MGSNPINGLVLRKTFLISEPYPIRSTVFKLFDNKIILREWHNKSDVTK
jgi:hypothetical protein